MRNRSERKQWLPLWPECSLGGRRRSFVSSTLRGNVWGLHACGATSRYIVPLANSFLNRLFAILRLKRKDCQEVARPAWAQESEYADGYKWARTFPGNRACGPSRYNAA
jgi:hypothetical protein